MDKKIKGTFKEKVAFLAIGQAGGNIGILLEQEGFEVLYINTSQEDLDTLSGKYTYHIKDGNGCNKDRVKAKKLALEDFESIASEVENKLSKDISFIFTIFSAGGGTGSGAGPMLIELLMDETDKGIGAITILPDRLESTKTHMNAYECFRELTEVKRAACCFVLDNDKGDKFDINKKFVEDFVAFTALPENINEKGNIDQAEMEELLMTRGMSIIATAERATSQDFMKRIGAYSPIEGDQVVKYIALSDNGEIALQDIERAVGTPLDTYRAWSENAATVCCLSGLSFPQSRLNEMYQKVGENKEVIVKNLTANEDLELKRDIDFLTGLISGSTKNERPNASQKKTRQTRSDIRRRYLDI